MNGQIDFSGCSAVHRERFLNPLKITLPAISEQYDANGHLSPVRQEIEAWRFFLSPRRRRKGGLIMSPEYYDNVLRNPIGLRFNELPAGAVITMEAA